MPPIPEPRVDAAVRFLVSSLALTAKDALITSRLFSEKECRNINLHRNVNKGVKRQYDIEYGTGKWDKRQKRRTYNLSFARRDSLY